MTVNPIVAATDGSEHSLQAVEWAAKEAVLRGAPLRIVSAAETLPRMSAGQSGKNVENVTDVLHQNRDSGLSAAAARAAAVAPGLLIDSYPITGAPAEAVADSGSGALMLVVGSRGAGAFTALVFGSVSRYVSSHASCPVVVIRDIPPSPQHLVGVGVADLDTCGEALTFAFEEAALRKASLTVIHAAQAHDGEEEARKQLGGFLDSWR